MKCYQFKNCCIIFIGSKSPIPCLLINNINIICMTVTSEFPIKKCFCNW